MRTIKTILFLAALLPLTHIVWRVWAGMEVNPVEALLHSTGTWALVFLLLSLTITPARQLTGFNSLIRLRRMLGLYAFFYACCHLGIYVGIDQGFDWPRILPDVWKRPFITVGFACFLLLLPLAITSTEGWMRRLKRNWGRLHRLVYPAAILAVLHYWWLVKRDVTQPAIYASLLAVLLIWRVIKRYR